MSPASSHSSSLLTPYPSSRLHASRSWRARIEWLYTALPTIATHLPTFPNTAASSTLWFHPYHSSSFTLVITIVLTLIVTRCYQDHTAVNNHLRWAHDTPTIASSQTLICPGIAQSLFSHHCNWTLHLTSMIPRSFPPNSNSGDEGWAMEHSNYNCGLEIKTPSSKKILHTQIRNNIDLYGMFSQCEFGSAAFKQLVYKPEYCVQVCTIQQWWTWSTSYLLLRGLPRFIMQYSFDSQMRSWWAWKGFAWLFIIKVRNGHTLVQLCKMIYNQAFLSFERGLCDLFMDYMEETFEYGIEDNVAFAKGS